MTEKEIFTVKDEDKGMRLDAYISRVAGITRSSAAKRIESGEILVCGRAAAKKYAVRCGDEVEISISEPEVCDALPENIPLDIIFEDEHIAVINKPSGMVVHPAPGNYTGTLVNALLFHMQNSLSGIGGVLRPGIVHRIDNDTSGLLVVAKTDEAHTTLSAGLKDHSIMREYRALVKGGFKEDFGTVDLPIGRHPQDRKRMAVIRDGSHAARNAVTHYEVLERFGEVSYLKLNLETGRTHQIRVHMATKGHALIGDEVYGSPTTRLEREHRNLINGQMLHAKRLTFEHPISKELLTFECDLPDNFTRALEILRSK